MGEPEEPSQEPPRLDFNSQSEESLATSRREDTLRELVLVPQSTSQPSLSTSQLRSSSSLATPPRITRRALQAHGKNHHRRRWCPPQHQRLPSPQGQGMNVECTFVPRMCFFKKPARGN